MNRVVLTCVVPIQRDLLSSDDTGRAIGGGRIHPMCVKVGFGASYEKGTSLMQHIQSGEVDIPSIHDVDRAGLGQDHIESVHIVQLSVGNMDKTRDVATQIQQCVHLHGGFGGPKMGPREQRQAQINRGRIQRVNGVVKISQQALANIKPSRLRDQSLRELRINAPVTGFVGIRQR